MKQLITILALVFAVAAHAGTNPPFEVNEKVLHAFKQTFVAAQEVTWYEYDEYVQANFKQEHQLVKAQFDNDGHLLKTYRYYGEADLMPTILNALKKRYPGREINGVTEVATPEEVNYEITLKDEKNWYIVKSDFYGRLQQVKKMKRGDN